MQGVTPSDGELSAADQVWLAHIVGTPDHWRARATNAAGLLSAAAAATLLSVVLGPSPGSDATRPAAFIAASLYVASVASYLVASVIGSPRVEAPEDSVAAGLRRCAPGEGQVSPGDRTSVVSRANEIQEYCRQEARQVRRLVWIGTSLAILAICATGVAAYSAATARAPVVNAVVVASGTAGESLERLCTKISQPFAATVATRDEGRVELIVAGDECDGGDNPVHINLEASDVALLSIEEP